MQNYISYNYKNEFKVGLIYLEQWELLGCDYWVLFDGHCDSPKIDLTCKGSLGWIRGCKPPVVTFGSLLPGSHDIGRKLVGWMMGLHKGISCQQRKS
jgi:hypothetical protein